jgi:predicted alpha/beta hydrolase family esterase
MKNQILFLHSAGSQGMNEGSSNLVADLKNKLGAQYEVLYPIMPHPENPQYKLWKAKLKKVLAVPKGKMILVGHSLGGSVLLKYLSENKFNKPVAGLFLIATPYWGKEGWKIAKFMLKEDFASKLRPIPEIFFYHCSGDDVVSLDHLHAYKQKLPQAKVRVIEGDEHQFNGGLTEIIEDIKNL